MVLLPLICRKQASFSSPNDVYTIYKSYSIRKTRHFSSLERMANGIMTQKIQGLILAYS